MLISLRHIRPNKSVFSFLYVAVNTTLLATAAERSAAVDVDRKVAAPAASDASCSNRSISPALGARGSKPAARCSWDRETEGELAASRKEEKYANITSSLQSRLKPWDL